MAQKKHKVTKLSSLIEGMNAITPEETLCILREIALRLEVLGRDRHDDLIEKISSVCTCGTSPHLPVCPQSEERKVND